MKMLTMVDGVRYTIKKDGRNLLVTNLETMETFAIKPDEFMYDFWAHQYWYESYIVEH